MPINGNQFPFDAYNIGYAPDRSGVYALWDRSQLIYYGASDVSIRSRLRDHHSGSEGRCTQGAAHFACEETGYPFARERELLEEFRRGNGRLPRCNEV